MRRYAEMIAMLGMYDMPAIQSANNRFWTLIRSHLGAGPDHLNRQDDPWDIWRSPDLLLAQTCGLPFRTSLHSNVRLIGTPDYGLPGCPAGYYNSVLVAHKDAPQTTEKEFDGKIFAYNEPLSQSGWAAPMTHLAAFGVAFEEKIQTGYHAASALAVAKGQANLASLDALTWAMLQDHEPVAKQLRVIAGTVPTPGLPYVTARTRDPRPIARAIHAALSDLSAPDRKALHLRGVINIPKEAYFAVPTPPAP